MIGPSQSLFLFLAWRCEAIEPDCGELRSAFARIENHYFVNEVSAIIRVLGVEEQGLRDVQ